MRKVPLSPLGVQMVKEQLERFERRFGRKPLPGEPLAFDPDAPGDTPRPLDPAAVMRQLIYVLRIDGADEALIYAVEKTGLLLTEKSYATAPKHIRDEWDAAIAGYNGRTGG